jgi:hypothetical protein
MKAKVKTQEQRLFFPQVHPLNLWELNSEEIVAVSQIGCFHQLIWIRTNGYTLDFALW